MGAGREREVLLDAIKWFAAALTFFSLSPTPMVQHWYRKEEEEEEGALKKFDQRGTIVKWMGRGTQPVFIIREMRIAVLMQRKKGGDEVAVFAAVVCCCCCCNSNIKL